MAKHPLDAEIGRLLETVIPCDPGHYAAQLADDNSEPPNEFTIVHVMDALPRSREAMYAAALVLAGEEHPEVTALRAELTEARERLAAAELALVTAQNDLDAAGQELAKRSAEWHQARADAERHRERAHELANQVVFLSGYIEATLGRLVREGRGDLADDLRKVLETLASRSPA